MNDEMLDAWDRLNKITYRVQTTQASDLSGAMRDMEEARKLFESLINDQLKK